MTNGWTSGQYALFRMMLGAYLGAHFLGLVASGAELFSDRGMLPQATASPLALVFPNMLTAIDTPAFVTILVLLAVGASVLLAAGIHDRAAAVFVWYVWACLLGRNPLISNPGLPYVGWLLLAHAVLPRASSHGEWRMPARLFAAAWILMALGYTYSGATKLPSPSWVDGSAFAHVLVNPLARPGPLRDALLALPDALLRMATWGALTLELLFAPLALVRRLRPWIWTLALAMHLGLVVLIDFADLSLGMVVLHLFTFDPAWVAPAKARGSETVFYDGGCGLCHRTVRFLLAEDRVPGGVFRFAPLGGATFRAALGGRSDLPDSLVLLRDDGTTLTRSRAVLHIGRRLGGVWRVIASLAGWVPGAMLDRGYDAVARARRRWQASTYGGCPIPPPHLRARLLA